MIKKLARSIREYKRDCILTPVFVVVEVIMEVLIPFLMAKLIDEVISSGDMAVMRSTGTATYRKTFPESVWSKASCGRIMKAKNSERYPKKSIRSSEKQKVLLHGICR